MNTRILNRDVIKYIAMATMLCNHIANIFMEPGTLLFDFMIGIGYFTAPVMCYFLAEGYHYTHSKTKYAMRLAVFAVSRKFRSAWHSQRYSEAAVSLRSAGLI